MAALAPSGGAKGLCCRTIYVGPHPVTGGRSTGGQRMAAATPGLALHGADGP